jgi:hypothetical protein
MKGQRSGWLWVMDMDGHGSHATTVQVHNRNVLAEVALVAINVVSEEWHNSAISISQVVSDRGVENFPDFDVHAIYRTGVTSITFGLRVFQSHTRGRWTINFWS